MSTGSLLAAVAGAEGGCVGRCKEHTVAPAIRGAELRRAGVVEGDVDRAAIIQEMDDARRAFHRLLESADTASLYRRSDGTRWTNEQLLFHMMFGYMIVRALLVLVRVFGRLPAPVGKGFAAVLDFATVPFDAVNYWGSRCGATVFDHRRMEPKLDRVVASLQRHLRRESAADLARSMSYPTRWDPFFTPTMTLADIYRYPTQHFDFHRQQLSGSFRRADGGAG